MIDFEQARLNAIKESRGGLEDLEKIKVGMIARGEDTTEIQKVMDRLHSILRTAGAE